MTMKFSVEDKLEYINILSEHQFRTILAAREDIESQQSTLSDKEFQHMCEKFNITIKGMIANLSKYTIDTNDQLDYKEYQLE